VSDAPAILVINCGSSSVKFALYANQQPLVRFCVGAIERIGLADSRFRATDEKGDCIVNQTSAIADHQHALHLLLDMLEDHPSGLSPVVVGHRVVHGGSDHFRPQWVAPDLLRKLARLTPLAPLHLPHNLAGIAAVEAARSHLPQVVCFDTAFHQNLPRRAQLTGLPRELTDAGIHRYGFHGLSYEYVMQEMRRRHGPAVEQARIVVAHLGNGASMAAIQGGQSVATTMGFSTLGGLPMGTRSGDLDPGILLYLLMEKGLTAPQLQQLLYQQSGLLGISGLSRNMQELLAQAKSVAAAEEAVDYFCYQARKHLAALTATLGGLDRLVFTGGIGAKAPEIRARICEDLGYLGIHLDPAGNAMGASPLSSPASPVVVEAFSTDEELVIAHHVQEMLASHPMALEFVNDEIAE
tara:strand:+ start:1695 stop:2924 length:1230 start_codon:yes stop_codon:yes gene_type:complete